MNKLNLANLPTKIEPLMLPDRKNGPKLWIKRDDQTGLELTGNKVRKLEYLLADALEKKATAIITCGAIGSNHARATAYASRKLGLKPYLVLAGDRNSFPEGNHLYDILAGAEIKFITGNEYDEKRMEIMERLGKKLEEQGEVPYIIPEGASDAIGSLGYVECFEEILRQEKEMEVNFDAIVVTVGSAGTFAGLCYGNALTGENKDILGVSISKEGQYTKDKVLPNLFQGLDTLLQKNLKVDGNKMTIIDGFQGLGYAKSRKEEITFIKDFIQWTGIILDPVYTGKAMYSLYTYYSKGEWDHYKNILFIHTGGAFGWTKEKIKMFIE